MCLDNVILHTLQKIDHLIVKVGKLPNSKACIYLPITNLTSFLPLKFILSIDNLSLNFGVELRGVSDGLGGSNDDDLSQQT